MKDGLSAERLRRRASGNAEMLCIKEDTGHQEYCPDLTESIGLRRRAAYNISQIIPFVNGRELLMYPYRSIHSNIKRTRKRLHACGIRVPLGGTEFGFIRSVSRTYSNVNTKSKNKFSTDTDNVRKSRSQRDVPTEQAERARPEAEEIARKWGLSGKKAETVRRGLADICESADVGVRLPRAELPTYTKPWMLTLSPPGFCGGARTL